MGKENSLKVILFVITAMGFLVYVHPRKLYHMGSGMLFFRKASSTFFIVVTLPELHWHFFLDVCLNDTNLIIKLLTPGGL